MVIACLSVVVVSEVWLKFYEEATLVVLRLCMHPINDADNEANSWPKSPVAHGVEK